MRVTDSLRTNALMHNIETALNNYNTVQQQISTGKKLNQMSDDPIGGSQSLALRATLVDNAQYQTNADAATAFLSAGDNALNSANSLMQSARQISIQGANGTQSPQDLQALGQQVDSIIRQMTQLANSDLHGKYLFGGTETQKPPFTAPATGTDPTPTYIGDNGSVTATLGKNDSLALNTPGGAVFGPVFTALQSLRNDLTAGTQTAVSADIDKISGSITNLTAQRAIGGSRLGEVKDIQQRLVRSATDYQDAISSVEDVDLAQAYVQLQSTQNVYQASLVATSKSFQFSLSDYLH